ALDLVDALRSAKDLSVEWAGTPWTVTRAATAKDLKVRILEQKDWFGLEGEAHVDGERVTIAALLEAARHGKRFLKLRDAHFVSLGKEIRSFGERLEAWVSETSRGLEIRTLGAPSVPDVLST